jgi:hypothetical protein
MALFNRSIVLFMLLVASATTAQGRSNWVVFAPKGPGFRVELPMEPTVNSGDVKTTRGPARATYFFFKGENGLEGRMEVKDYQLGKIGKDSRGYLDESMGYHENRHPIRSQSRFSLDGAPAQRFVVETVDGRVAKIQEVVIGDRFISVICFVPKGQENSPDIDRIFKSFVLTKI